MRMVTSKPAASKDEIPGMAPAQKIIIAIALVAFVVFIVYVALFNAGKLG